MRFESPSRQPEPIVFGRLSGELVMKTEGIELEKLLLTHTKRSAGKSLTVEEILTSEAAAGVANGDGLKYAWTKDNLIRLALMSIDGRSASEMASIFNIKRPSKELLVAETVRVLMSNSLSELTKELGRDASYARRWQALTQPEDPDTESIVQALEKKTGMKRELIFIHPEKRRQPESKKQRSAMHYLEPTLFDPGNIIKIAYQYFLNKLERNDLCTYASDLVGYPVARTSISGMFVKTLTQEARDKLGMSRRGAEKPLPWTTEDYERVANIYIADEMTSARDIGRTISRSRSSIIAKIRREGRRLCKKPEYEKKFWLAAFLLEHGAFSEGVDPEVRAEQIVAAYRTRSTRPDQ